MVTILQRLEGQIPFVWAILGKQSRAARLHEVCRSPRLRQESSVYSVSHCPGPRFHSGMCYSLLVSLSVVPGLIFFASPITFCFGPSVYPSSLLQALCRVCHITRACVCMYMHAEGLGEDSC